MHLLIVEDDIDYAAALGAELAAMAHEVRVAHDGRAALEAVDRDGFDAIVLDCMLPEVDGMSVVRRLRERGSNCRC